MVVTYWSLINWLETKHSRIILINILQTDFFFKCFFRHSTSHDLYICFYQTDCMHVSTKDCPYKVLFECLTLTRKICEPLNDILSNSITIKTVGGKTRRLDNSSESQMLEISEDLFLSLLSHKRLFNWNDMDFFWLYLCWEEGWLNAI